MHQKPVISKEGDTESNDDITNAMNKYQLVSPIGSEFSVLDEGKQGTPGH